MTTLRTLPTPFDSGCLHSVLCTLTQSYCMAGTSRISAVALSPMAGGGTLPASHRHRRHLVVRSHLPARICGAHVAKWRSPPVFPPTPLAEVLPSSPNSVSLRVSSVPLCFCSESLLFASFAPLRLNLLWSPRMPLSHRLIRQRRPQYISLCPVLTHQLQTHRQPSRSESTGDRNRR